MNIFILDLNIEKCAEYHCDDHVRKMAIEACQMLTATIYYKNGIETTKYRNFLKGTDKINNLWKDYPISKGTFDKYGDNGPGLAYINHPCTIWARTSLTNAKWLTSLGLEICKQFQIVFDKEIVCKNQLLWIENYLNQNSNLFNISELTSFAQAMPDQYKNSDPVVAYRNYYKGEKIFATWKNRTIPDWWLNDQ